VYKNTGHTLYKDRASPPLDLSRPQQPSHLTQPASQPANRPESHSLTRTRTGTHSSHAYTEARTRAHLQATSSSSPSSAPSTPAPPQQPRPSLEYLQGLEAVSCLACWSTTLHHGTTLPASACTCVQLRISWSQPCETVTHKSPLYTRQSRIRIAAFPSHGYLRAVDTCFPSLPSFFSF
jgi:hypothetical protein